MTPDSLFSRNNREGGNPDDPAEGVRIIKADEAAEAVERGEAVPRKADDQPKYGDRPPPPQSDVRPALRFPLSEASERPHLERPRAAPVEESSLGDRPEPSPPSHAPPAPVVEPPPDEAPITEQQRPAIVAREDLGLPVEEPIISVEPASGETELPHWTAPATGEVPKVVVGDLDADDADEQQRWSSFAASTGPRWREEHESWETDDVAADLAKADATFGALDTSDRPSQEAFLTFDDLAVPAEPESEPEPTEPIRIQSSTRPTPPRAAAESQEAGAAPSSGPTDRAEGERRHARAPRDRDRGSGRPPPGEGRDVPQAIFVGVAIGAVAIIMFSIGAAATMVLVEVVVVLAGIELFNAVRRGGFRPATLLGLAAVAGLPLAVYWRGEPAMPLVLVLTLVFTMLWFMLGVGGSARPLPNMGITIFGVVYVGLLGSFAALILTIPEQGVSILLVAVIGVVFYDVGGFFIGRRMGRTPLASVSPNKTLEGLVGGLGASLVAVFVTAVVLDFGPFSAGEALAFWFFVSLAAFFGDLAESLLKRDLGLKDMGSLLPGHGGVLDRFDGILFALPVTYYFVRMFDLVPGL
jgi:phosphatidate cytidylyltransferase